MNHAPLTWVQVLGLSTVGAMALGAAQSETEPYDELTNTYRPFTNFNVETVRGLDVTASGSILFINTHGSFLNVFVPGGPFEADFVWPTVNNPIAVDSYVNGGTEYALVLGGGTHALVLHDLTNGEIVGCLQLPAETGDVVVDQENDHAFVSCPGNNTVVQVALPSLAIDATFTVLSQRPRFLYFDPAEAGAGDNVVYVAPELSGNNTASTEGVLKKVTNGEEQLTLGFGFSIDFKPFLASGGGLPDHDLFRIQPVASPGGGSTAPATPVLRNAGTLLMAHGRNPITDEYWIVGVDAKNAQSPTEPGQKGIFAVNQLTIAPALSADPIPYSNTTVDLDLVGGSYDSKYSVSFPYALAFHPSGNAAIAGSASDQIRAVDIDGVRIGDLELPPGSIPRGILFDDAGLFMLVYCWGTNEVRVYDVAGVVNAMAADPDLIAEPTEGYIDSFDIGLDPSHERIRHGRELFYDADNSLNGRVTCNHCHPGGGMDLIGWNIADYPHDSKDIMVTQSLKSIEDTFPYHWRGERDLEAFNVAFEGLLGGAKLDPAPGGDFDDFKAFVFSLQAHANPRQSPSRELDPGLSTVQSGFNVVVGHDAGDPIEGQTLMDLPATLLGRFSCADCHGKPAGTVGDPQFDDLSAVPANTNMDVAHFRQLFAKDQDIVPVTGVWAGTPFEGRAVRSGYGLSHDGNHSSIFDFLDRNAFDVTVEQKRDLAAFVEQADQGIAPSAHRAYFVDASTDQVVLDEIDAWMIGQAGPVFTEDHWVSLALIGTHQDQGGVEHALTWYFLPGSAPPTFYPSDPTVVFPDGNAGSQTWDELKLQASPDYRTARFTLIGLPPSNALRFAVDRDEDGLNDYDETNTYSTDPFDPDSDHDGDPDGHEVFNSGDPLDEMVQSNDTTEPALTLARMDHMGATYGKYVLGFSEPVTLEITAVNTFNGHQTVERRYVPRAWDTVTVQRLQGSQPGIVFPIAYPIPTVIAIPFPYYLSVKMFDLGGQDHTEVPAILEPTRDRLIVLPFLLSQEVGEEKLPPAVLSRTIESLEWEGTPGSGPVFQANATVGVRFDVPELEQTYSHPTNTPNGSSSPLHKQVVVANVLHFDSSTGTWNVLQASPGSGLTVSAPPDRLQPTIVVRGDPTPEVPDPGTVPLLLPSPVLLSTESDPSGNVTFDFTLSQAVPAGDKIKLNILAILEQDDRDAPPPNEFWFGSNISWNMPITAEEKRGITSP